MTEPHELTLVEAAAAIREGRLAARDLVESLLDRIERLDPLLHAWVRLDAGRARATAGELDAERSQGRLRGALHGVPVGLKDIYFTAGLATEAGSPLHAGFVPERDARTVARLRQAGAIVLGKTETTQFAYSDPAPTRNPWNTDHTPGGSSSGCAAAVAARMVPAALGTQTAGSILRPAAFCGVVGFKATAGRLSLDGIFPLSWSLDHPGPIARSVADLQSLFAVLDEQPVPGQQTRSSAHTPLGSPPGLGLLGGRFLDEADADALRHFDQAVRRLSRAGAAVREVRLPDDFDLADDVHHVIMRAEAAAYHRADHVRAPEAYRPNLRAAIELGSLIPAPLYLQAQRLRNELLQASSQLFDGVDCLIMPSALGEAPADLTTTGNAIFNAPWSLFGMPALTIPSGLGRGGLPLGLQIIGRRWQDATVLAVGSWCESALGTLPIPAGLRR